MSKFYNNSQHTIKPVNKSLTLLLLLLSGALTACGTIMHGKKQEIAVSSNPADATVFINDKQIGITPVTADLKREHKSQLLRIELEGYLPFEMKIMRKVSGWAWGNIVFGGLPGIVVDAISGGLYKLTPEQIKAGLKSQTASIKQSKNGFHIAVVLKADPAWQKIGQLKSVR